MNVDLSFYLAGIVEDIQLDCRVSAWIESQQNYDHSDPGLPELIEDEVERELAIFDEQNNPRLPEPIEDVVLCQNNPELPEPIEDVLREPGLTVSIHRQRSVDARLFTKKYYNSLGKKLNVKVSMSKTA